MIDQVGGSSDEEDEDKNVWVITKEQYSYYVTQFRAMQANPRGVIPGTQVINFLQVPPHFFVLKITFADILMVMLIPGERVL